MPLRLRPASFFWSAISEREPPRRATRGFDGTAVDSADEVATAIGGRDSLQWHFSYIHFRVRWNSTLSKRSPVAILVSKTRAQGASVVTTLPAEVARRLSVTAGQELEWIEDGMGGFRVVPHTPETAEALAVHEQIMAEYDAVFRALAK